MGKRKKKRNPQKTENLLLCAYWGDQSVPSRLVHCSQCHAKLAMDVHNQKFVDAGIRPVCVRCIRPSFDSGNAIIGGAIMHGKMFEAELIPSELWRMYQAARARCN